MKPLFDDGPTYDPHVSATIKMMLSRLRNNHPKPGDKVWIKNANFIKSLYDGLFLHQRFDMSRNDNPTETYSQVRKVKGDWSKVRDIIALSLNNIDLAKSPDYMPFNKKYVESISFATFFESFDITSAGREKSSNFLNFVIAPKKSYEYTSDLTIAKLKKQCTKMILETGERICKRYMSEKSHELSFWYSMTDWSRWLRKMKETFPNEYGEFLMNCDNGNPLLDFRKYLMKILEWKQGENIMVGPECFKLSYLGHSTLEGHFKNWLRNGVEKNKFNCFKYLPKSIEKYYQDDSFVIVKEKKTEKKKEIIDADDLPIF